MSTLIEAVVHDVWTEHLTRFARVDFDWRTDPPRIVAWRAQGDMYRFAQEPMLLDLTNARTLMTRVDTAISAALSNLPPLTDSEALEAGERRRFLRQ